MKKILKYELKCENNVDLKIFLSDQLIDHDLMLELKENDRILIEIIVEPNVLRVEQETIRSVSTGFQVKKGTRTPNLTDENTRLEGLNE